MKLVNPFKPTAGMTPPILVGRESVMDDFRDGLDEGPGSPGRLMRITGPRGSGKTVLLTELGDIARAQGWMVLDVAGTEPLCETIRYGLERRTARVAGAAVSASLPFVKGEAHIESREHTFREVFGQAVRELSEQGSGLLITIDEVQDASYDDMRVIASNVQYMIRERRNVALLFAGLTTGVLDLLNGKALTFLRRAKSEELSNIPLDEVAQSLSQTFERSGLHLEGEPLRRAAEATQGYAYLIQLVGYWVWRVVRRHEEETLAATLDDVNDGVRAARREFDASVIETALAPLTKTSVEYLMAMAHMGDVCATSEVAERMGKSAAYAASYRRILIRSQLIESTAPGYVTFSIPFLRDYLLQYEDDVLARYGV